ncbi:MAG: discoidin domain-containing protein [Odoribacteraceae bacterium]|jgi:hypothetical protein|nr:discoidin domain-containing protein [Odoribacteraceae bacterium]
MKRIKTSILLALGALACACNEALDAGDVVILETVEFEADRLIVPEEGGAARIPVFLSGRVTTDVELTIKVEPRKDLLERPGIMAEEGVHYRLPEKSIRVPVGATQGYFPLEIIDDILVNDDRVFDVVFEMVSGATRSFISQACRVTLRNDDFWPTVSFGTSRYQTTEHDSVLVIPLVVGGGVIRSPLQVTLAVEDLSAVEGTNFTVVNKTFTFTEANRLDSIVIRLADEELSADADFNLSLASNDAGRLGRYPAGTVVIRDVVKRAGFPQSQLSRFKGYRRLDVPVLFDGVRSPRDITARLRVKDPGTLVEGVDFTLVNDEITTKGDTTLYATLEFVEDIKDKGLVEILLEVYDVDGGAISAPEMRVFTEETTSLERDGWGIYSFSSEEASGEGANNGRAAHILDGNLSSYWHSKWTGAGSTLPHEIVIQFPRSITPEFITVYRRPSGYTKDTRTIQLETSLDGLAWESIGALEFGDLSDVSLSYYVPRRVFMSFLRLRITESNRSQNANMAELFINGIVNR